MINSNVRVHETVAFTSGVITSIIDLAGNDPVIQYRCKKLKESTEQAFDTCQPLKQKQINKIFKRLSKLEHLEWIGKENDTPAILSMLLVRLEDICGYLKGKKADAINVVIKRVNWLLDYFEPKGVKYTDSERGYRGALEWEGIK